MANILEKKNNKLEELKPNLGANQNLESLDQQEQNQTKSEETKGGWINTLARGLAVAPVLLEQFTGQKLPVVGGTLGEMQNIISQLALNFQQFSTSLATVINNQQQIFQRIVNLETNASQQLVSLDKRLDSIQSIRLTHEREKKQIEYNQPKSLALEENEDYE